MRNIKQSAVAISLALITSLMSVSFVQAQDNRKSTESDGSPSLAETADWLKSKIENSKLKFRQTTVTTIDAAIGGGTNTTTLDNNIELIYKNLSFEDCGFQWTTDYVIYTSIQESGDSNSEPLKQSIESKVNLSAIDPLSLKVAALEVDTSAVNTNYRNQRVKSTSVYPEIWSVLLDKKNGKDIYGTVLLFDDREMAKRVANGFQNAIKKCGGKVEPF
jgi:hypothetical protein